MTQSAIVSWSYAQETSCLSFYVSQTWLNKVCKSLIEPAQSSTSIYFENLYKADNQLNEEPAKIGDNCKLRIVKLKKKQGAKCRWH